MSGSHLLISTVAPGFVNPPGLHLLLPFELDGVTALRS